MKYRLALVLALVVFVLILLVQNAQVVTLRILFWKVSMSQLVWMSILVLVGFISGFLTAKIPGRR